MRQLEGRDVVVTGASGGLGATVVGELLAEGATCYLPFFESTVPERLDWREHPSVHIRTGVDLQEEQSVADFYRSVPKLWASVQLVGGFTMGAFVDTSLGDFDRMLALNLRTTYLCCREAVRAIGGRAGRLLNVSARPALRPEGGMVAYAASKAGVASMTQCLSEELRGQGIWVNAIVPSIIDTPANREAMPDADHESWPKPEQLARTVVHLVSPDNALTSGSLVPVYGKV